VAPQLRSNTPAADDDDSFRWRDLISPSGRVHALIGAGVGAAVTIAIVAALGFLSAVAPPAEPRRSAQASAPNMEPTRPPYQPRSETATRPREAPLPDVELTSLVRLSRGGTLAQALDRAGVGAADANDVVAALATQLNPRRLAAGQLVELKFEPIPGTAQRRLAAVVIPLDLDSTVIARRAGEAGFVARREDKALHAGSARVIGSIDDSLFVSAQAAGMPIRVIMDFIRLYSWDVDFQREIQPGDRFEVLFEQFHTEVDRAAQRGVKVGEILYASLTIKGDAVRYYRYRAPAGVDYFNAAGESVRKALLKTPLDGAKLTSGFGKRTHPILGYTRMHRGVDFAAPVGTPIVAAGNGTVEVAGTNGAYGNYVRIRHSGNYQTAYAHLSRFGSSVRAGRAIKQGQTIGYVGTTGLSTGPHLHYEIMIGGNQVNPVTVKFASGDKLNGRELAQFRRHVADIDARVAALPPLVKVATRE
jgi:murein DD-endopeptidase MepM/ murein hydrolase activator NlpD